MIKLTKYEHEVFDFIGKEGTSMMPVKYKGEQVALIVAEIDGQRCPIAITGEDIWKDVTLMEGSPMIGLAE